MYPVSFHLQVSLRALLHPNKHTQGMLWKILTRNFWKVGSGRQRWELHPVSLSEAFQNSSLDIVPLSPNYPHSIHPCLSLLFSSLTFFVLPSQATCCWYAPSSLDIRESLAKPGSFGGPTLLRKERRKRLYIHRMLWISATNKGNNSTSLIRNIWNRR